MKNINKNCYGHRAFSVGRRCALFSNGMKRRYDKSNKYNRSPIAICF